MILFLHSLRENVIEAKCMKQLTVYWICGVMGLCSFQTIRAQESGRTAIMTGIVLHGETGMPCKGMAVRISHLKRMTYTDHTGVFTFPDIPWGTYYLTVGMAGFRDFTRKILVTRQTTDAGIFRIYPDIPQESTPETALPVITLDETDMEEDGFLSGQQRGAMLTAARNPFQQTAAFTWGGNGFRMRSYPRHAQQVLINGIVMNDPATGTAPWFLWGGLNEAFRERSNTWGLEASDETAGAIGGTVAFDITAASRSRQTRISWSQTNRQYRQRLMLTHYSGLGKKGWAYAISFSRRWADEGYIPGTFYDAYAAYAAITRKYKKQELSLTAFVAPLRRGGAGAAVAEVYALAGTRFYNPNWGYQEGKKRNARITENIRPVCLLTWKLQPNLKTAWQITAGYQYGISTRSSIDWYNGKDPRPDYYRYLPSWQYLLYKDQQQTADAEAAIITQQWQHDASVSQINWDRLYQVNNGNYETIRNESGIQGNDVHGRRSVYVSGSDVETMRKYSFSAHLRQIENDHLTLTQGLQLSYQQSTYFKRLDDLLGGDFFVNYNQFAERTYAGSPTAGQQDRQIPDRAIRKGDHYQYHYGMRYLNAVVWGQAGLTYRYLDAAFTLSGGVNRFSREGYYRNGLFPEESYGKSPAQAFINWQAQAGLTGKITGRHYVFIRGTVAQEAPYAAHIFITPRTRNRVIAHPQEQRVNAVEAGLLVRTPVLHAAVTGYSTDMTHVTEIRRFYNDDPQFQTFVNYVMNGIRMRFTGLEIALEIQVSDALSLKGIAAIGQSFYTGDPEVSIYRDNDTASAGVTRRVYLNQYYIGAGPQSAYTCGFSYRSRHYWYLHVNGSFLNRHYLAVAPDRRTEEATAAPVAGQTPADIIFRQERLPDFFTADIFAGKSLRLSPKLKFLPRNSLLSLSVGINNLLDNRHILTGGYEQLRYDFADKNPDKFPPKYFYGMGRNYFISLSLRL